MLFGIFPRGLSLTHAVCREGVCHPLCTYCKPTQHYISPSRFLPQHVGFVAMRPFFPQWLARYEQKKPPHCTRGCVQTPQHSISLSCLSAVHCVPLCFCLVGFPRELYASDNRNPAVYGSERAWATPRANFTVTSRVELTVCVCMRRHFASFRFLVYFLSFEPAQPTFCQYVAAVPCSSFLVRGTICFPVQESPRLGSVHCLVCPQTYVGRCGWEEAFTSPIVLPNTPAVFVL